MSTRRRFRFSPRGAHAASSAPLQPPLRAALYSAEQLRAHGVSLAERHVLAAQPSRELLLDRLGDNQRVLAEAGRTLATAQTASHGTPAAQWLLDNLYLIEQEIAIARRHLPPGYSRQLPRLVDDAALYGLGAGQPRIFDLALNAVAHGDGRLVLHTLSSFLAAYQRKQSLRIGELWAFPIMLRLALIENLRRVAEAVADAQRSRDAAAAWAERMLSVAEAQPDKLILVVADLARAPLRLDASFVAELTRRLQGRGASMALPLSWLAQRLGSLGHGADALRADDSRQQAEWQLSVANSIGSLRLLDAADWAEFVEEASAVEQLLRRDPAGVYARMDFASRDAYRHAVEDLARRCACDESELAQRALQRAAAFRPQRRRAAPAAAAADGVGADADPREAHVGHHLVGDGRAAFEADLGLRPRLGAAALLRRHVAAVLGSSLLFCVGVLLLAWQAGADGDAGIDTPGWAWVLLLPALGIGVSQLAVALVNWLATLLVAPRKLPRLDTRAGLPPGCATLVVVPTLLSRAPSLDAQVDALEVHHLAHRELDLRFALLTDLCDAAVEQTDGDGALIERAARRIAALNQRHAAPGPARDRFFLLHRPRRHNPCEGQWMGRERKRGKLADLNALLRGRAGVGPGETFARAEGDWRALTDVRYVITLDSDTELPQGSAARLVATMAHPLQRPQFGTGDRANIVVQGHAVLQPRSKASLPSALRSRFARLSLADAGIDPYTQAVSDVYQDLFDEGSFVGKGIYDVDAFERALAGRLPDNRVLSHDLIEGCHARAGLVSDVAVFEQVPARHAAEAARVHRWTRGDWQLLPWLFGRIAVLPGRPRNPLSALSRLKLFDNLRRSLVSPALLVLLLLGWGWLPAPWLWTALVVAVLALVPLLAQLAGQLRGLRERPWRWAAWQVPALVLLQRLALLPDDARLMLDAIGRTLWRLAVSRRHLLQWTASAELPTGATPGSATALREAWRDTALAPLLALATATLLALLRPEALPAAVPLLALWALAPLFVWWLDQPSARPSAALSSDDRRLLRMVARRTWAFFEDHGGAADHALVPDNVQQQPVARIAHRTSPTNIGFALLAPLAARELGQVQLTQLLERVGATLHTLESLERFRGHFFNWYDTTSLQPLAPRYVSSVDSGNLCASLLVLRTGLLAQADAPVIGAQWCAGMRDTLWVYLSDEPAPGVARLTAPLLARLDSLCQEPPATLLGLRDALAAVHADAARILAAVAEGVGDDTAALGRRASWRWMQSLTLQCRNTIEELNALVPAALLEVDRGASIPTPSLRALAGHAQATPAAQQRLQRLEDLAARALALTDMDHEFLYDRTRRLLAIGWHVDEQRRDAGSYDLLASEARLGVYVAIALGRIPPQAWFALGRNLSLQHGQPVLLSWSGSMFEYLMPALLMPQFEGTLLEQSCRAAVQRQIEYGRERGVPWGVSESGYNATDHALNYQYRAFGVPGLGLKRGLGDELVVAPYATLMALPIEPQRAVANLKRLAGLGALGDYGFFEALDYSAARLPPGQPFALVRSFMAHHQGMALLGLTQLLAGDFLQQHFKADAALRASLPLLHERVPDARITRAVLSERADAPPAHADPSALERRFDDPDTAEPQVQLLSNGRYHVMLTQAGGGCSRWQGLALTRWHEDFTRDHWGSFCYLRDLDSGRHWSNTHQPTLARAQRSEAVFVEGRAVFTRLDHGIETRTTVAVSAEDDIELRRVRLRNLTRQPRTIELTSYAEVVLASAAADAQHPAFSKLFVMTEILPREGALLARRRPRAAGEQTPWMFHLLNVHAPDRSPARLIEVSHQTDRAAFIGRRRSLADPLALHQDGPLPNTDGAVLDPVLASRCVVTIDAERSRTVDLVSGVAASRDECLALIDKYRDRRLADRVFELAWTHAQMLLRQLDVGAELAQTFARIAGVLLYAQGTLRADAETIRDNRRSQAGLWGYAISGDLPIVLLTIGNVQHIELVRELVQAHAWWRHKGLAVDLVIWNEERDTYRQRLHEQILGLAGAGRDAAALEHPGGIFVRHADQIAPEDRQLLRAVARAVFSDAHGTLAEQLRHVLRPERRLAPAGLRHAADERRRRPLASRTRALLRDPAPLVAMNTWPAAANGYGELADDGRSYRIAPDGDRATPMPWSNVLANAQFGCVLSESGSAYTWFGNAHEFRLTPWHNDPVTDRSGEAFYLRDEDSGEFWSPTPWPAGAAATQTHHGLGFSRFEQMAHGVHSTLTWFVAADAPLRVARFELHNRSDATRRLSLTAYAEWVLGSERARSAPHVVCEVAGDGGALLARNAFAADHAGSVAFADAIGPADAPRSMTCHRTDFIGRNRSLRDPQAMQETRLSGRSGAALDPCAALQLGVTLAAGERVELAFTLGAAASAEAAQALIERLRRPQAVAQALQAVHEHWAGVLGAVQVRTPDAALDALVNGWLPYQTVACRLWARSGYYQSGGAYGFRDQLQDAMAMVHTRPDLLREQLLRCAARQFPPGDVQHWWHPPGGQGVRSTCSDDYLWLPLALVRYWRCSGDAAVLDESVPFIDGRPVPPGEESYYDRPLPCSESASLYEHARRAVEHGLRFGAHGLPLMGSGDWNDGMNRVGHAGRGESVWLGFFLCQVLQDFAALAHARGDFDFAARCLAERERLARQLEAQAWDGAWYRRAWFDDGQVLGSATSPECRIDLIAQSWALLSGVAGAERAATALRSMSERLVDRDHRLVRLLAPPFDGHGPDPGYIAGYLPGVRENGGQYTHGAVWAAMALAEAGDVEAAWQLFDMINPLQHARSADEVRRYQVEPYVAAADVYGVGAYAGRGGWTWYTGSAGWMYRLIVESLLGLRLEHDGGRAWLTLAPRLPAAWPGFEFDYRRAGSSWQVQVRREAGAASRLYLDGVPQAQLRLPLDADGGERAAVLLLGG